MSRPAATLLSRRSLLTGAGAALVVGYAGAGSLASGSDPTAPLTPWVRLDRDGTVTFYALTTDIGQGSPSGIAQIMAEELRVDWSRVHVEQPPLERPYTAEFFATGGSNALQLHWERGRKAAAAAREMLTTAAARRWGVSERECETGDGEVRHRASGRHAGYGDLVAAAAHLPVPANPVLATPAEWRLIGRSLERLDVAPKVAGRTIYAIDVTLPGMLTAAVAQCPHFGGRLVSMDQGAAMAVPGVRGVFRYPAWTGKDLPNMPLQETVAVVADDYWRAEKGMAALAPKWSPGGRPPSSEQLMEQLRQDARSGSPSPAPFTAVRDGHGEPAERALAEEAFRRADAVVEAEYELPLLAQAPMEPMSAVARWSGTTVEIWSGAQAPLTLRSVVADRTGVAEGEVVAHMTAGGGGFGRRWYPDAQLQAALIARDANAPVRVVWTRKEDTRHSMYRPPAVARLSAAIRDHAVQAVRMHQARMARFDADGPYKNLPYDWPAMIADFTVRETAIPYGAWRSVESAPQAFFLECFVDEIAHALGRDPLRYRRDLLARQPRALRLLNAIAEMSGWETPARAGQGRGLAMAFANGSIAAQVAEVTVDGAALRINRISCAFDCGTAVNPDSVLAQGEGSIIYGLSACLFGEITVADGAVEQSSFADYPVVSMANCPTIDIRLLETPGAEIGGVRYCRAVTRHPTRWGCSSRGGAGGSSGRTSARASVSSPGTASTPTTAPRSWCSPTPAQRPPSRASPTASPSSCCRPRRPTPEHAHCSSACSAARPIGRC